MPIQPKRLPFFEHVAELRQRLIIIVLVVVAGSMLFYVEFFYVPILTWLLAPIRDLLPGGQLKTFGPFELFTFRFKVATFASIVVFSPVIIWQVLAFFIPALKQNERKWVVPTFIAAALLFLGGAGFAYGIIMRPAFEFIFGQGVPMVGSIPDANRFLGGIMLLMIGFGLAFEIPILVFYSIGFGLIPYEKLRANWRYVYAGLAIIAAVATPDWSPVTMGSLGAALIVLYEASLLLARFVFAKRIKERELAQAEDAAEELTA